MSSCYNEINTLSIQIAKLANEGLTDKEIGEKLCFSFRTIYRYRHSNNIKPGRSQRKRKPRNSKKEPKQSFNLLPLDKLVMD